MRNPEREMMNSGSKIKYYRIKKKISQSKLGQLVGLDVGRIRTYEACIRTPKEELLKQFADVLDCKVSNLKSYNVSDYEELKACLLECVLLGGKDFCLDCISGIDDVTICEIRKFCIRETKEVLLNVTSEEYESAMRK